MDTNLLQALHTEGLLDADALDKCNTAERDKLFSVRWELGTILYFGILLLASGFSLFVYKNIDSIGHITVIALIAVLTIISFVYCARKSYPFSFQKVNSPSTLFDYVLLLGCLLLLTFFGYAQYQYHIFGVRWGLATFIPMLLLFFCAYYFDHLGVLSLAVTNLAAWAGIAIAPLQLLNGNDFGQERITYMGIALGLFLHLLMMLSVRAHVKPHFAIVYKNFGTHLLFVSILAGLIHFDRVYLLWFLVLLSAVAIQFLFSVRVRSFYFLVASVLYGYIGLSYVVVRICVKMPGADMGVVYLLFIYFIASAIGFTKFLMHYNKILNKK